MVVSSLVRRCYDRFSVGVWWIISLVFDMMYAPPRRMIG